MSAPAPTAQADSALAHEWGIALFTAHCNHCGASFLVSAQAGAPLCLNCLAARLEPQPAPDHATPPELILSFSVPDATLQSNLQRWLRGIPFKPASMNPRALHARLTRVLLPLYLADASVWGTWQAQVGFDYLVASSEERFDGKTWVSQRVNETRVRWEPRVGDITRKYENLVAPALEQHSRLMLALGATPSNSLPYELALARPYTPEMLGGACVQLPEIAPNAAWHFAQENLERRAAQECEQAAGGQHHEQFVLHAAYGEPVWTLLLLPVYVTSYSDDDNKWIPVRINAQTGFVSGPRRASQKQARRWSLALAALAGFAFVLTLVVSLAAISNRDLVPPAGLVLLLTFFLCLAAPVPLLSAWEFNRRNVGRPRNP